MCNFSVNIYSLLHNKEAKNASWLICGRVVQMVLSLFVGILTARYLGPGNYGLISYAQGFVTFFSAFCNLGLNSVIIKDFIDHPDEQGTAIGSVLLTRAVSSILSAISIFFIVSIIDSDEPSTIFIVVLCSLGLFFNIFETFNYWFQNRYQSKISSIATLVSYILTSLYKIVLLVQKKSIFWFAFSTSIDYIFIAIFLYLCYRKYNGPKLKFSSQKARDLLSVSYNYILSSLMVVLYGQTDKFMLKQMLNESEVGFYTIATGICGVWTFVLKAIIDSMYPSILRLKGIDQSAYEKKNRLLYASVFYISLIVSIFFVIFGGLFIKILYGADYLPAIPVLQVLTWHTIFSYLGVARDAWIVSENVQKYLKYMYGCAVILNISVNLLLIPSFGATGAAIASLITQIATSIILPLFIPKMRPNARLMLDAIFLRNIRD